MLFRNGQFLEISFIISYEEKYFLLCDEYESIMFDVSKNSIQIEKKSPNISFLLDFDTQELYKSYDKLSFDGKYFIQAETLEIYNNFQ